MGTPEEPAGLRRLRWLVTGFTITMIAGVLTIIVLLVIRLTQPTPAPFPESFSLPGNATPMAVTRGPGWWAVVTTDSRILVYTPDGTLLQEIGVSLYE